VLDGDAHVALATKDVPSCSSCLELNSRRSASPSLCRSCTDWDI